MGSCRLATNKQVRRASVTYAGSYALTSIDASLRDISFICNICEVRTSLPTMY